jgi:hypothetical protein
MVAVVGYSGKVSIERIILSGSSFIIGNCDCICSSSLEGVTTTLDSSRFVAAVTVCSSIGRVVIGVTGHLDGNLEVDDIIDNIVVANGKNSVPYTSTWVEFEGGDTVVIHFAFVLVFVGRG